MLAHALRNQIHRVELAGPWLLTPARACGKCIRKNGPASEGAGARYALLTDLPARHDELFGERLG